MMLSVPLTEAEHFNFSEIIAACSLAFNMVAAVVALTWGLGRVRDAVRDEIDENRDHTEVSIDNLGRSFGESLTGIREKIREVELFGRDTYMRRESFYKTMEMLGIDIKAQFGRLDLRLDRMETKLDQQKAK